MKQEQIDMAELRERAPKGWYFTKRCESETILKIAREGTEDELGTHKTNMDVSFKIRESVDRDGYDVFHSSWDRNRRTGKMEEHDRRVKKGVDFDRAIRELIMQASEDNRMRHFAEDMDREELASHAKSAIEDGHTRNVIDVLNTIKDELARRDRESRSNIRGL